MITTHMAHDGYMVFRDPRFRTRNKGPWLGIQSSGPSYWDLGLDQGPPISGISTVERSYLASRASSLKTWRCGKPVSTCSICIAQSVV